MAEESKTLQEAVNEAMEAAAQSVAEQFGVSGVMCNSWALVGEWSDMDGALWLVTRSSANLPSWRVRGMLGEAIHVMGQQDD